MNLVYWCFHVGKNLAVHQRVLRSQFSANRLANSEMAIKDALRVKSKELQGDRLILVRGKERVTYDWGKESPFLN